jgi:AraC-like DNA-binding protein
MGVTGIGYGASARRPTAYGSWAQRDIIRTAPLKELRSLIKSHGGNSNRLFGEFGIDPKLAEQPDRTILCSAYLNLLERCSAQLNAPYFGLELSKLQTLDSFGPIAPLVQSASTVREGLQYLAKYQAAHAPSMAYSLIDRSDSLTEFCATNRLPEVAHKRHGIELGLGLIARLLRQLSPELRVSYIRIGAERPVANLHPIRQYLGCDVLYNQPINSIAIPTKLLGATLATHDDFLAQLMRDHLDRVRLRVDLGLDEQVGGLIHSMLGSGRYTLETCAWQLGMAPRTLQSRLASLGTDFSAILSKQRRALADHYLCNTRSLVSEIASTLGYSDRATFTRAFTTWTGQPPSSYRRAHMGYVPKETAKTTQSAPS